MSDTSEREVKLPMWALAALAGLVGGGAGGTALGSLSPSGQPDRTPEVIARLELIASKLDDLGRRVEANEVLAGANRDEINDLRKEQALQGRDISDLQRRLEAQEGDKK